MGAVFSVLLFPLYRRLIARRCPHSLAASLLSLGLTAVALVPASLLIYSGAKAGVAQLREFKEANGDDTLSSTFLGHPWVVSISERIERMLPEGQWIQFSEAAKDAVKAAGLWLGQTLSHFATQVPGGGLALLFAVLSTYFFLVDGRSLAGFVRRHSMFDKVQTDTLIHTFESVCRSVILASLVSGFVQSLIFSVAYLAVGGKSVALVGLLVFIASFVPLLGSGPVTFGLAAYYFLQVDSKLGLVLLIAAVVVAVVDNIIRPMILKGSANLHPLLGFLAVFGGLQTFGFAGVFLGPIIIALAVACFQAATDHSRIGGVGTR